MRKDGTPYGNGIIKGAVLIAGPTASGKSAWALALAERDGCVIVNADSMQVYSVLDALTARPTAAELQRVPHLLYGHVHPSENYSTGAWLREVRRLAAEGGFASRRPIFVGGTGLYFRALTEGLSEMPDVPAEVRARWRARLEAEGAAELHRLLARDDPTTAAKLRRSDGQRIIRALEVLEVSGRSIRSWQAERGEPIIDAASSRRFVIEPPRPVLVERIEARFARMISQGALDEVKKLHSLGIDPSLPAMKAIGVRELWMALEDLLPLDDAVRLAVTATRQYAKRQSTWFRHQLGREWQRVETVPD